jgi:hypothetical protein
MRRNNSDRSPLVFRLSILAATDCQCGPMECVDDSAIRCGKCDMRLMTRPAFVDPEGRKCFRAHPHRVAQIKDHVLAKGSQRGDEKLFAASDIRNGNADMIEHRCTLRR